MTADTTNALSHGCNFFKSIGGGGAQRVKSVQGAQNPDEIGFLFMFDPFSHHNWGGAQPNIGGGTTQPIIGGGALPKRY